MAHRSDVAGSGGISPFEMEPFEFSKEDIAKLKRFEDILEVVLRTVSGDNRLKIKHSVPLESAAQRLKPGVDLEHQEPTTISKGWYYVRATDEVYIDPVDTIVRMHKGEEEVLKGIIAHEGGHAAISDLSVIPESIKDEMGFSALLAAAEELPTDQVVRERASGAGEWVNISRRTMAREGESKRTEFSAKNPGKNLYNEKKITRLQQICGLIVYAMHGGRNDQLSDDVLQTYDQIEPVLRKIEQMLPEPNAGIGEIKNHQIDRFISMWKELWPEVKELLEKDILDMMVRAHDFVYVNHKIDGEQEDEIDPEKLLAVMEDEKLLKTKVFDKLEDDEKKMLEEMAKKDYDNLSDKEKELLRRIAIAIMEEVEDQIIIMIRGVFKGSGIETHQERAERQDEDDDGGGQGASQGEEEDEEKLKKMIEELKRKQEEAENKQATHYEKTRMELIDTIKALSGEWIRIVDEIRKRKMHLERQGTRADMKNVVKRISAKKAGASQAEERIWREYTEPGERDLAVAVAVDCSTSMRGVKIKETFKGLVTVLESLETLQFDTAVIMFGALPYLEGPAAVMKPIDEKLEDASRVVLEDILVPKGGTPTESGVDLALQELQKSTAKQKLMIVLTDGLPWNLEVAKQSIANAHKEGVPVIVLGLGPGTDGVKDLTDASIPNMTMDGFALRLGAIAEELLKDPDKFLLEISQGGGSVASGQDQGPIMHPRKRKRNRKKKKT
ncbi:MAG: vWA domain-containing protein [Patescibacteria group bacterium]